MNILNISFKGNRNKILVQENCKLLRFVSIGLFNDKKQGLRLQNYREFVKSNVK